MTRQGPAPRDHVPQPGLGRAVRLLRAEHGLSRSELGTLTGISSAHLAEIEDETAQPHPAALSALARALDIPPGDLASLAESLARDEPGPAAREGRNRRDGGSRERTERSDEEEADGQPDRRPERRVRSFTMPLMGGEWEATPGPEPPRRKPGP